MRILVVSDSHGLRHFMCRCVDLLLPDMILHLGDYYEDGEALHADYPEIRFLQVAGNCDAGRTPMNARLTRIPKLEGVQVYMTHGHVQHVKQGLGALIADGRKIDAKLILFGHTHRVYCEKTDDGIWVLNPGTCGNGGKTAALLEVEDGKVLWIRIFSEEELYDNKGTVYSDRGVFQM